MKNDKEDKRIAFYRELGGWYVILMIAAGIFLVFALAKQAPLASALVFFFWWLPIVVGVAAIDLVSGRGRSK
jgi:hypothetical protein